MNSSILKITVLLVLPAILLSCLLASCGSSDTDNNTPTYTVGGTVTGLSGTLVLRNNGGNARTLTANGSFTFSTALTKGTAYSVTVSNQPVGQTCTVANGSGTVGTANVTNVQVACTNNTYTVGGTVSGLQSGTLVLRNNGGDALSVTANGSFTFNTALTNGTAYSVTVSSKPVGYNCTVTNGAGTIGAANVTNIQVTCIVDNVAPSASIVFPPANSMTDGNTVTVYGTASDNGTIAAVRVNGLNAQTSDGYSNWEVSVPLATGSNTLTVATEDSASNTDPQADQAVIERKRYIAQPDAIALDNPNNRYLVTDNYLSAVIAVDLTTGERTVLSDKNTPDANNSFVWLEDIAIDSANNRALALDSNLDAVIAVDLTSGARTVLSDNSTPDANNPFDTPRSIAIDSANNRALVVDSDLDAVIAVDLISGARTVLSDDSTPDANNRLDMPRDIAIDSANNRALVADIQLNAVIAVDLTSGARTVLHQFLLIFTPPFGFITDGPPNSIAIDSTNNRALVTVGSPADAVIALDLTTGASTVLSDDSTPDADNPFVWLEGITMDSANNRVLVTDSYWDAVIAVGLTDGSRTMLSDDSTPDADNPLVVPRDIAMDSANNRILVVDALGTVIAVDLTTGVRAVISDNRTPDDYSAFSGPNGIAPDPANNRVLITDADLIGTGAVIAVDLTTGAHSILSDNSTPNNINSLGYLFGIAMDSANNRVLVVDGSKRAVISVDLTTGARTILSDNSTPDANNPFMSPRGIVLDSTNNRALVTNIDLIVPGAVIAVDLTTGARTVLTNGSIPDANNPFDFPISITLDPVNNRALVTDIGAVIAVDLTTGARTVLSGEGTPDNHNLLISPNGIALDSANNQFIVGDTGLDALIKGHLESGERVIFSK
jgi:sugar lactone lactonase YvrE